MTEPRFYMHLHVHGQDGCRWIRCEDKSQLLDPAQPKFDVFDVFVVPDMQDGTEFTAKEYAVVLSWISLMPLAHTIDMVTAMRPDFVPAGLRELLKL